MRSSFLLLFVLVTGCDSSPPSLPACVQQLEACKGGDCCGALGCINGFCMDRAPLASSCASDEECESANCDAIGGWCTQNCNSDNDCPSTMYCEDGLNTCAPECFTKADCQNFTNGIWHTCQPDTSASGASVRGCGQ